jgi:hypothetical protein
MSIVDLGSCSIEEPYTRRRFIYYSRDVYLVFRLVHSNIMLCVGIHQICINAVFPTCQTAVSLNRNIMSIYSTIPTRRAPIEKKNITSLLF